MKYIPGPDFPTAGIITTDKTDNGIESSTIMTLFLGWLE
jgi:DNA gyrase/topoisomerase IV subunit A